MARIPFGQMAKKNIFKLAVKHRVTPGGLQNKSLSAPFVLKVWKLWEKRGGNISAEVGRAAGMMIAAGRIKNASFEVNSLFLTYVCQHKFAKGELCNGSAILAALLLKIPISRNKAEPLVAGLAVSRRIYTVPDRMSYFQVVAFISAGREVPLAVLLAKQARLPAKQNLKIRKRDKP